MRNKFFALIAITFMATGFAIAEGGENLKPRAGAVSVEVNLAPFQALPIQANQISARYFLSPTMAARVGFNFGMNRITDTQFPDPNNLNNEIKAVQRVTEFGLRPGVEMHIPVSNRFSPYVGGELGLIIRSASAKVDNNFNNDYTEIKGDASQNPFTRFVLRGVVGFDVYLVKGLYLGAEMGYGLARETYPDQTTTTSIGGTVNTTSIEDNSVFTNFGVTTNPFIRLGWTF